MIRPRDLTDRPVWPHELDIPRPEDEISDRNDSDLDVSNTCPEQDDPTNGEEVS